ncbi:MAG: hypothetical protein KAT70_04245, partial [Thermoplasmata archaeon]|nr:hypothetical protein [Thermoplasmata archaeon]
MITVVVGGDVWMARDVEFWLDDVLLGTAETNLFSEDKVTYTLDTTGLDGGFHTITAVVDPQDEVNESNEEDNTASTTLDVWTVPYLIEETIALLDNAEQTPFIDNALRWLDNALGEYEKGELNKTILYLHHALDEVWKDGKHTEIEYNILDAIHVALYGEEYVEEIVDTVKSILSLLAQDIEHPLDQTLENALQHLVKALEATAKGLDPMSEICQGWDKLYTLYEQQPELLANSMTYLSPDLELTRISFDTLVVVATEETTITATIYNRGPTTAREIVIDFYETQEGQESEYIGSATIDTLRSEDTTEATIDWTPTGAGIYAVTTTLEGDVEKDPENNGMDTGIAIAPTYSPTKIEGVQPPPIGDWIIDEPTWMNDTEYFSFSGNIIITSTGHFYLQNSTLAIESKVEPSPPYSLLINSSG